MSYLSGFTVYVRGSLAKTQSKYTMELSYMFEPGHRTQRLETGVHILLLVSFISYRASPTRDKVFLGGVTHLTFLVTEE